MDLLSRDYSAGHFSPLGAGASATGMDNERGLTWMARRRDWRLWVGLTARPAPVGGTPYPPDGSAGDYTCNADGTGGCGVATCSTARISSGQLAVPADRPTSRVCLQSRQSGGPLRFTTRVDGVRYQRVLVGGGAAARQHGLSLSTAIRFRLHRFRFDGLATMYATDSYHARIYQYEPELPQAVSIRPVYGTGVRLVAVAQVQVAVFRLSTRCRLQQAADGM